MKKYRVYYTFFKHGSVEVKADSNIEAEDIVWDMAHDGEISDKDTIDLDYEINFSAEIDYE